MSEKIIYELGISGVDSTIAKIAQVNAALSNLNGDGVSELNRKIIAATANISNLSKTVKTCFTAQTPFTKRGTSSAIDQGLVPTFNLKDVALEAFAKNVKELREFRQRVSKFNRNILKEIFKPTNILQLPYVTSQRKSDVYYANDLQGLSEGRAYNSSIQHVYNDIAERHKRAEKFREKYRNALGKNNPWSDFVPPRYPIVPVGQTKPSVIPRNPTALFVLKKKFGIVDTGRVTDYGYTDAEWREIHEEPYKRRRQYNPSFKEWWKWSRANSRTPYGFFRNMSHGTGIAKWVGKFGLLGIRFNFAITALSWFGKNLKRVAGTVKDFGLIFLRALDAWKQLRESYAYGTSMGSLASQWKRQLYLGGDAASASALWRKFSTERAMLAYGGNGGSMMEAARLFGLNILGSGDFGYATNDELMRNVATLMTKLKKSSQIALANVLGLNDYDMWSVSHGTKYYDWLSNRPTLLGSLTSSITGNKDIGNQIYSQDSSDASRRFIGAWNEFLVSLNELGGVLGEAILPALTILTDTLTGIAQIISTISKPASWLLNKFFNLFSTRFWSEQEAIKSSPSEGQVRAKMIVASGHGNGVNNVTLNVGDISLNSLGLDNDATQDEIRERVASVLFNQLGDHLVNDRR